MKLSRKCEYALLALIDIGFNGKSAPVKIGEICERNDIPKKFLEQILLVLKGSGYVKSRRGSEGGYMLAKPSSEISLAEVVRLFDGALAPVESVSSYFFEHTPIEKSPALLSLFQEIRDYISSLMEKTSLEDILCRDLEKDCT